MNLAEIICSIRDTLKSKKQIQQLRNVKILKKERKKSHSQEQYYSFFSGFTSLNIFCFLEKNSSKTYLVMISVINIKTK